MTHFDMDSSSAYSSSDMAVCVGEWREEKSDNKDAYDNELSDDDGHPVLLTWDSAGHWRLLSLESDQAKDAVMTCQSGLRRIILGQAGQPLPGVILLISANISDQSILGYYLALDTGLHVLTPTCARI